MRAVAKCPATPTPIRQFREALALTLSNPARYSMAGRHMEGVTAKGLNLPYLNGDRTGMLKFKRLRTADFVVVGSSTATSTG